MDLHLSKLWIQQLSTVMYIDNMKNLNFTKFYIHFNFCKNSILLQLYFFSPVQKLLLSIRMNLVRL